MYRDHYSIDSYCRFCPQFCTSIIFLKHLDLHDFQSCGNLRLLCAIIRYYRNFAHLHKILARVYLVIFFYFCSRGLYKNDTQLEKS